MLAALAPINVGRQGSMRHVESDLGPYFGDPARMWDVDTISVELIQTHFSLDCQNMVPVLCNTCVAVGCVSMQQAANTINNI